MTNRNRSQPRAPFKPATFVTKAELDELAGRFNGVLSAFAARLTITETALGSVINDVYATTPDQSDEGCGCEDCDEKRDSREDHDDARAETEQMISEGSPVFDA